MNSFEIKHLVLGGVVLLLGVLIYSPQLFGERYDSADLSYNAMYWEEQIKERGGTRAYEEFIKRTVNEDSERQHVAAHVMGEELFKVLGEEGVVHCDVQFGFGCYHGFFGRAVSEGGTAAIQRLDAICVKAFGPLGTGCQHGIGHGILEYVGYEAIEQGLTLCKETTQLVPLLGCTSGVFMEYHTPLAGISDALIPQKRTLNPLRPHEPCDQVSQEYRASCYYELGLWLTTTSDTVESAGAICDGLTGDNRTYCYMGIGVGLAHGTNYMVDEGIEFCEVFAAHDALSCRAGLAWGMYMVPEHRLYTADACEYTDTTMRERCMTLADFTEGRDSQFTR